VPLIFWIINREKSKFATFHSLQALWFHIAFAVLFIAFVFVIMFVVFGSMAMIPAVGVRSQKEVPMLMMIAIFATYGFIFVLVIGMFIYSIVMGIKAYGGNLNKYPVIGKIVYRKVYGR